MAPLDPSSCEDGRFDRLVSPYCFGDLTEDDRHQFELHLLHCEACWQQVSRLGRSVDALRRANGMVDRAGDPDVIGVLGLSGRLETFMAGHALHAAIGSAMFAVLFAVPILVEVAYQFDRFGGVALRLAPLVLLWVLATTFAVLWLDVRGVRRGAGGVMMPLAALVAASLATCAGVLPFLPGDPMTEASFGTWPGHLAYLKSVFYAWLVGPIFLLLPFHFVVVMQRQLASGRHREVCEVLGGDKLAVPPPGALYPRVWALTAYLAGLFALNYAGLSHLFDGLDAGPYKTLFMSLVLVRVSFWLGLPAVCIWWYASRLGDLRRECRAARLLGGSSTQGVPVH